MAASSKSVFRCGALTVGTHHGEVADLYAACDAVRPAGRAGRGNSLYASPTLLGVTRWVAGNALSRAADLTTRELRVNPAGLYAYSVDAWETATLSRHAGDRPAMFREFWATGIALEAWDREAATRGLDPREWEVLLPVDAVTSTRTVSDRRLLAAIPESHHSRRQLMFTLQPRLAARGVCW